MIIREIMEHSNITATMKIYNEATNNAKYESIHMFSKQLDLEKT